MKPIVDCRVLYSDTDSLLWKIHSNEDLFENILPSLSNHFDFSNYPETHPLFNNENKMLVLKLKDELASMALEEFVGLKSKMYSITHLILP